MLSFHQNNREDFIFLSPARSLASIGSTWPLASVLNWGRRDSNAISSSSSVRASNSRSIMSRSGRLLYHSYRFHILFSSQHKQQGYSKTFPRTSSAVIQGKDILL